MVDDNGSTDGGDEPIDGDALSPWVWAFLGEYPAAGIALGPTLAAWQRIARESANPELVRSDP